MTELRVQLYYNTYAGGEGGVPGQDDRQTACIPGRGGGQREKKKQREGETEINRDRERTRKRDTYEEEGRGQI